MAEIPFLRRYLSEKISLQKMAGSLSRLSSTLSKASIELNPYQISAALYAFNSPLQRGAVLADEVGLGKTIEAGIIISQLWAEGKRRVLIITPASLRKQWQDELSNKFGLNSEIYDGPSFAERVNNGGNVPLTYEGIFIVSYQFAYTRAVLIEKQSWNAVFIDEAHRMRRVYRGRDASKMAYEIRRIISDKPKVLLTATPLQNNLMELYGIASFIDDKLLGTPYGFKTRFVDPLSEINEANRGKLKELRLLIKGEESNDPLSVSGILIRTLRKEVLEYVRFTERKSMTFDFRPTDEEIELYEKVSSYLQRDEVAAINTTQRNLMILVYRKLLASSSFAIAGTLIKLVDSLEKEFDLRAKEDASKIKYESTAEEAEDEGIEEELEETDVEISERHKSEKSRVDAERFSDEDIQKEIEELKSYYNLAVSIEKNSKGNALISALKSIFDIAKAKGWPQKAVLFTESRRTQEYISSTLKHNGISFTIFNGSNASHKARKAFERWCREFPESASTGSFSANMRLALVYDFEKNSQILLTTEAGAEGLNLQFCNIVINYDLPWNPQRIEQRIGRCHRYGQRHEVVVANFLNTKNRADRRLLELLQTKLNLFDGLFGTSDEILGALESGIDFEKRILEIYQSCKTPEEIDIAFDALQESLQPKISDNMMKLRSYLTEFDDSVKDLFKKTKFDTENAITELDNDLLKLCSLALEDDIRKTPVEGIYELSYNDNKHLIAFRNLKENEIGKILRAHKEHPVISDIISKSLTIETNPPPSITFNYSEDTKKISQIEAFLNKDGFIFLFKLRANGIETEELLAPLTFIKEKKSYKPIDLTIANQILTLDVLKDKLPKQAISELPFSKAELLSYWNNWRSQALQIYQKKNERLYDREIDRINRYYQDYALKVDDKINKLEKELAELNRKRDNSTDLAERRELHKKIRKAGLDIEKLRIEQIKLKEEAFAKKQTDLEELDIKFEMTTEEKLIAVTHFKIV